ncbi:hypothetical protein MY4824_009092 [Beauveria thailandica]
MRIVAAQSQCMRHRRSQRATRTGGQVFTAKYVISAVPLNVLSSVAFNPPFEEGKATAAKIGHVNQTIKVHAEILDQDLRPFTGISYPHNSLIYGFGDGETPAGNTHVVAFGGQHKHFHPEDDINRTISEFHGFTPMQVERGGNIFFASSNWASGWRSFIDGAIEEGTRAAASVQADLIGQSKN